MSLGRNLSTKIRKARQRGPTARLWIWDTPTRVLSLGTADVELPQRPERRGIVIEPGCESTPTRSAPRICDCALQGRESGAGLWRDESSALSLTQGLCGGSWPLGCAVVGI